MTEKSNRHRSKPASFIWVISVCMPTESARRSFARKNEALNIMVSLSSYLYGYWNFFSGRLDECTQWSPARICSGLNIVSSLHSTLIFDKQLTERNWAICQYNYIFKQLVYINDIDRGITNWILKFADD